jgi:hypothetical protein
MPETTATRRREKQYNLLYVHTAFRFLLINRRFRGNKSRGPHVTLLKELAEKIILLHLIKRIQRCDRRINDNQFQLKDHPKFKI